MALQASGAHLDLAPAGQDLHFNPEAYGSNVPGRVAEVLARRSRSRGAEVGGEKVAVSGRRGDIPRGEKRPREERLNHRSEDRKLDVDSNGVAAPRPRSKWRWLQHEGKASRSLRQPQSTT